MLLKMHYISSLIIQLGAFFSFLFIYFNPFVEKISPLLHDWTLKSSLYSPTLVAEKKGLSLDLWSQHENKSRYYHFVSPKGNTWRDSRGLSEEFCTLDLTLQECFKDLCFFSSEKGLLNLNQFDLSLMNTSVLFPSLGNGFAKSVTISSFTVSPSVQMKEFSGYVNSSTEAL
jgi:hypothetical protein